LLCMGVKADLHPEVKKTQINRVRTKY